MDTGYKFMATKSENFNTDDLSPFQLDTLIKWLSCNGEVWGIGPTAVFASAAALFLYHELNESLSLTGDNPNITVMEKTLISTMVLGMLALMIHIWVCAMRFFQYYLETLVRDSPNLILEMTTCGLFGTQGAEVTALGPLTRFLRQQQPQIHITVCWFLSLCYADYVRKNYCHRFNLPYLEQWQAMVHERASRSVHCTVARVNSFVSSLQRRLRTFTEQPSHVTQTVDQQHTQTAVLVNKSATTCDFRIGSDFSSPSRKDVRGAVSCVLSHKDRANLQNFRLSSQDDYDQLVSIIEANKCQCSAPSKIEEINDDTDSEEEEDVETTATIATDTNDKPAKKIVSK